MKTGTKIGISIATIVVVSVGFVIYRKRKIGKNKAKAQLEGYSVGGCKNGYMTATHPTKKMGFEIPCGMFKF